MLHHGCEITTYVSEKGIRAIVIRGTSLDDCKSTGHYPTKSEAISAGIQLAKALDKAKSGRELISEQE